MPPYQHLSTQDAIDAAYNAAAAVPESDGIVSGWVKRSAAVRQALPCQLGLRYGATRHEHLDLFHAARGTPLHVFIHGGYWRRFSAGDFSFVAAPLVAAGVSVAVINYALCPLVSIDEIVRQARAAVAWCARHGGDLGVDAARLTVSGHSAGGHLAAMVAATDWADEYELPPDTVKGVIAVSGLFDLAPLRWSWLQPQLQLSEEQIRRNSPINRASNCPTSLIVGGEESSEFHRQSRSLAQRWGSPCDTLDGRNHFTVLEEIEAPGSRLLELVLRQAIGHAA